ncbi:hypothetical protein ECANGB1_1478 [Enterospora canceri]|uniref:Uncharacterized protein n=1 Tax=Enterospora canceri TaxID=1081671 RepID=A0A1Y1S5X6_9MICR|nr:hypothetical protein ECANGB1_1478 [Enterospora canceri]
MPDSSEEKKPRNMNMIYFIAGAIIYVLFILIMQFMSSSVLLFRTGLFFGTIFVFLPLIFYIFNLSGMFGIVSLVCLLITILISWYNRNVVYRVYISRIRQGSREWEEFVKMFRRPSALIISYGRKRPNYLEKYRHNDTIEAFLQEKGLVKDMYKIQLELKFDKFASPSGIVKKGIVIVPIEPTPDQINRYKIRVFGTVNMLHRYNSDKY